MASPVPNILAPTTVSAAAGVCAVAPPRETFHLRRAQPSDAQAMAVIATGAYRNTTLSDFLSPSRHQFFSDWKYSFMTRYRANILDPRTVTWVAYPASLGPAKVVGHLQTLRIGDDAAAKMLDREQGGWAKWVQRWWWWGVAKAWALVWRNRSTDAERMAEFNAITDVVQEMYWSRPEWSEHWHPTSVAVDPAWQRRGIGKILMGWVVDRAREEGVSIALEASQEGEVLYRQLGFRMLGRFPGVDHGGGVMAWRPEGSWKGIKYGGEEDPDPETEDEDEDEATEEQPLMM